MDEWSDEWAPELEPGDELLNRNCPWVVTNDGRVLFGMNGDLHDDLLIEHGLTSDDIKAWGEMTPSHNALQLRPGGHEYEDVVQEAWDQDHFDPHTAAEMDEWAPEFNRAPAGTPMYKFVHRPETGDLDFQRIDKNYLGHDQMIQNFYAPGEDWSWRDWRTGYADLLPNEHGVPTPRVKMYEHDPILERYAWEQLQKLHPEVQQWPPEAQARPVASPQTPWDQVPGTEDLPAHLGGKRTADYQGMTNWDTWNVKLWMDNERETQEISREFVRRGDKQGLIDWVMKHFVIPHNRDAMKDAQEWNDIPREERIDYHLEDMKDRHPEHGDLFNNLFGEGNVDDVTPNLIDPEIINWDEIYQDIENEFAEEDSYNNEDARLREMGIDFGMPGHSDETNTMLDAWLKHHGILTDEQIKQQYPGAPWSETRGQSEMGHRTLVPIDQLDPNDFGGTEGDFWKQNVVPNGGYLQSTREIGWNLLWDIQRGKATPEQRQQMQAALASQGYSPEQIANLMRVRFRFDPNTNQWEDVERNMDAAPAVDPTLDQPGTLTIPNEWISKIAMPYSDNTWYHVTDRSRLPEIAQRGLVGSERGTERVWEEHPVEKGAVYMWPNVNQAWAYAKDFGPQNRAELEKLRPYKPQGWQPDWEERWKDPVLLRIQDINRERLAPDHEMFDDWLDQARNDLGWREQYDPSGVQHRELLHWIDQYEAQHPEPDRANSDALNNHHIEMLRAMPPAWREEIAREISQNSGHAVMHYGPIMSHQIEVGHLNQYDYDNGEYPEFDAQYDVPQPDYDNEEEYEKWLEDRDQALDQWMAQQGNWVSPEDTAEWPTQGVDYPEDDSNTHSFTWHPIHRYAKTAAPEDWGPIRIDQLAEPYDFRMPTEVEQRFVNAYECPECKHTLRKTEQGAACPYCGWNSNLRMANDDWAPAFIADDDSHFPIDPTGYYAKRRPFVWVQNSKNAFIGDNGSYHPVPRPPMSWLGEIWEDTSPASFKILQGPSQHEWPVSDEEYKAGAERAMAEAQRAYFQQQDNPEQRQAAQQFENQIDHADYANDPQAENVDTDYEWDPRTPYLYDPEHDLLHWGGSGWWHSDLRPFVDRWERENGIERTRGLVGGAVVHNENAAANEQPHAVYERTLPVYSLEDGQVNPEHDRVRNRLEELVGSPILRYDNPDTLLGYVQQPTTEESDDWAPRLGADLVPGNEGHWVWLDGNVGFGGEHHEIARTLAQRLGYDPTAVNYISNTIARNGIPEGHQVAVGTIRGRYPQIYNSTVDRNAVWDDVARNYEGFSKSAGIKEDAQRAYESLHNTGGFSITQSMQAANGAAYFTSYAQPTRIIPVEQFSPTDIVQWRHEVLPILQADPNNLIGGWLENGEVYLDVSRAFQDEQTAVQFGRANGQLAVWDGFNNREIRLDMGEDELRNARVRKLGKSVQWSAPIYSEHLAVPMEHTANARTYYHISPARNRDSIMQNGLVPMYDMQDFVPEDKRLLWIWSDPEAAREHATQQWGGSTDNDIWEFEHEGEVEPDRDGMHPAARQIRTIVPPERLRRFATVEKTATAYEEGIRDLVAKMQAAFQQHDFSTLYQLAQTVNTQAEQAKEFMRHNDSSDRSAWFSFMGNVYTWRDEAGTPLKEKYPTLNQDWGNWDHAQHQLYWDLAGDCERIMKWIVEGDLQNFKPGFQEQYVDAKVRQMMEDGNYETMYQLLAKDPTWGDPLRKDPEEGINFMRAMIEWGLSDGLGKGKEHGDPIYHKLRKAEQNVQFIEPLIPRMLAEIDNVLALEQKWLVPAEQAYDDRYNNVWMAPPGDPNYRKRPNEMINFSPGAALTLPEDWGLSS